MILRTPAGGRVHVRQMFGGTDTIPAPGMNPGWSQSGKQVTAGTAVGLPAMLRGIRVLSETIAALPMIVQSGHRGSAALDAPDTPQWDLLHTRPNDVQTPYGFKAFMVASRIGHGGAYALKAKDPRTGAVLALYPIDPTRVTVKNTDAGLRFKIRQGTDPAVTLTSSDVLYVPGVILDDPYIGVSPIIVSANAIGAALATEEYAGRFFSNDATPGGLIEIPHGVNSAQARETKEFWDEAHKGNAASHKTGVLFGGATFKTIGLDAQAAQLVESQSWNVDQTARVLGLPSWILGGTDQNPRATPEQRSEDLVRFSLLPHTVALEEALHADDDLFPDKRLFPSLVVDGLMRASMSERYEAHLKGRQAGWLNVDEIRADEGRPPLPDGAGQHYQTTPVGGAPNLQPGQEKPAVGDPEAAAASPVTVRFEPGAISVRNDPTPVTVNVPERAVTVRPPVVNVTTPEVTVHPPEVLVQASLEPARSPRSVKFTKDHLGKITGMEG